MLESTSHTASSCPCTRPTRSSILKEGAKLIAAHALDDGVQFVQHQPNPQFRYLVHDDEQHLIVLARQRLLRIQQPVEPKILAIGERTAQVPVHALVGQIDLRRCIGRLRGRAAHLNIQEGTRRQPCSSSRSRAFQSGSWRATSAQKRTE